MKQHIHTKHAAALDNGESPFPAPHVAISEPLEPLTFEVPFANNLPDTAKTSSILLAVPWFALGGADLGALRIIETLTHAGYRVTVVCTLYDPPASLELVPLVMQWTHDIHILPSFLRPVDSPRYIKYLVRSRHINTVLFSNAMFIYELLPSLREQLPHVAFVDYLHNESDDWKSGGYPRYSILHQRYLDRTIVCSKYLKTWMIERGCDANRIGVVKLGLDLVTLRRDENLLMRESAIYKPGTDENTFLILSVGRLEEQKRSLLIPAIINDLVTNHPYACKGDINRTETKIVKMVMVGAGSLEYQLKVQIAKFHLESCFTLAGLQSNTSPFYLSADIFLLPSSHEGISLAVMEAMAAGLPIVATDVGALPELIGRAQDSQPAGTLVASNATNLPSESDYTLAIAELLGNRNLRQQCGENGRRRTTKLDWRITLQKLLPELALAHLAHDQPRSSTELALLPHPASMLAIQTQLQEYRSLFDFGAAQARLVDRRARPGIGRSLQLHCGEDRDPRAQPWIKALEDPLSCPDENALDVAALQQSALYQCQYCECYLAST